ncbi:hypothetical protein JOM56_009221 [Amanita muscaria]
MKTKFCAKPQHNTAISCVLRTSTLMHVVAAYVPECYTNEDIASHTIAEGPRLGPFCTRFDSHAVNTRPCTANELSKTVLNLAHHCLTSTPTTDYPDVRLQGILDDCSRKVYSLEKEHATDNDEGRQRLEEVLEDFLETKQVLPLVGDRGTLASDHKYIHPNLGPLPSKIYGGCQLRVPIPKNHPPMADQGIPSKMVWAVRKPRPNHVQSQRSQWSPSFYRRHRQTRHRNQDVHRRQGFWS